MKNICFTDTRFHSEITHYRPHLDEIVCSHELQTAEILAPLSERRLFLFNAGTERFWRGLSADNLEEHGYLALGVGTGKLNEHPTSLAARKLRETCFSLAVKRFNLDRPFIHHLLPYVTANDLNGTKRPNDLATLVARLFVGKQLDFRSTKGVIEVCYSILKALECAYEDDYFSQPLPRSADALRTWLEKNDIDGLSHPFSLSSCLLAAKLALPTDEANAVIAELSLRLDLFQQLFESGLLELNFAEKHSFTLRSQIPAQLIVVHSDNEAVTSAANIVYKNEMPTVFIQRNQKGQVLIKGLNVLNNRLGQVAVKIRMAEAYQNHQQDLLYKQEDLTKEGHVPGATCWYYHPRMGLMNGSLTAPYIRPTQLNLSQVIGCVIAGLGKEFSQSSFGDRVA